MDAHYKVVVVGDPLSGKTTLCRRLEHPEEELVPDSARGREHYPFEEEVKRDGRCERVRVQLVDQPGSDSRSLVPIAFRRAVALVILMDASAIYREYLHDRGDPNSFSGSGDGVPSPAVTQSALSMGSSSRLCQMNGESIRWDDYLKEILLMWKALLVDEFRVFKEVYRALMPVVVVFSKCDLLPPDDEATVTAFRSESDLVCRCSSVHADAVHFLDVCHSPPDRIRQLRQSIASLVTERVEAGGDEHPTGPAVGEALSRKTSVVLFGVDGAQRGKHGADRKRCCS